MTVVRLTAVVSRADQLAEFELEVLASLSAAVRFAAWLVVQSGRLWWQCIVRWTAGMQGVVVTIVDDDFSVLMINLRMHDSAVVWMGGALFPSVLQYFDGWCCAADPQVAAVSQLLFGIQHLLALDVIGLARLQSLHCTPSLC